MKTSRHIDWISVTIPNSQNWRNFIPFADLRLIGKGRHGYGQAWVDKRTGARIETASTRDDMGTHITLSGDVLNAMRDELGAVDDAIVERITQWDGQCSRIDLAIDCYGANFEPKALNASLLDGSAKIRARTWRFIDGHNSGVHGATVDTGSQKSDVRFRFYDKRAEQRIKDGESWVRLELQLRRLYAKAAISACRDTSVSGVVGSSIGAYLKWSHTDYQDAIAGSTSGMVRISRTDSNRQKWLLGQVARALAAEIVADDKFLRRFQISVNVFYEELLQKLDKDFNEAHND